MSVSVLTLARAGWLGRVLAGNTDYRHRSPKSPQRTHQTETEGCLCVYGAQGGLPFVWLFTSHPPDWGYAEGGTRLGVRTYCGRMRHPAQFSRVGLRSLPELCPDAPGGPRVR